MNIDSLYIPFLQLKKIPLEEYNLFNLTAMILMPHDYNIAGISEERGAEGANQIYHILLEKKGELGVRAEGNNQAFRSFQFEESIGVEEGDVTVWVHYMDRKKKSKKVRSKMNYQDAELVDSRLHSELVHAK